MAFEYEGEGRGTKSRLPSEEEEIFKHQLDQLQENRKGGQITALEIQDFLADKFDCCYPISGVYALLNIVWISGRSKHPKNSQETIEQFKKKSGRN